MKKEYSLFYIPEKVDFEVFSKDISPDDLETGEMEFRTELTEDELELQIVLKKKDQDIAYTFGFPQAAAYNPELSEDIYKILDLKQIVLVTEDHARYTFSLEQKNIEDIRFFMGL